MKKLISVIAFVLLCSASAEAQSLPRLSPPPGFTGGVDVASLETIVPTALSGFMPVPFTDPTEEQTVPADVDNPSAVTWTASPDHTLLDGYDVNILRSDGSILQTLNAAKPTPDSSNTCTFALNVQPIAFGKGYSITVSARAGTATSASAASLNKFNRVPGGPTKVIIK